MSTRSSLGCKAVDRYLNDKILSSSNVISALSRTFVECFLECLERRCKLDSLERFVSLFEREVSERLKKAYSCERITNLLEEARKHVNRVYESAKVIFGSAFMLQGELQSRLLVHTRSPTLPLDISLAWDPILNLPYIPSSSIKGVVRAYFEIFNKSIEGLGVRDLFGDTDHKDRTGHVGYVIFFDAYPVGCRETLIEPDVITPHYKEIEGSIDETSAKPVPIVFPTIAPHVTVYIPFAVNMKLAGRSGDDRLRKLGNTAILNVLIDEIGRALEMGVGAKTSLGYGWMKVKRVQRS